MSKEKVGDILRHAMDHQYGVAAVNTINIESAACIIKAAEREKMPIIVQFWPGFEDFTALKHIAFAVCDMAERASVPVGVHLDHSVNFDIAIRGICDGFPSVMVDGSAFPVEENITLTRAVSRVAHIFGVDVEAELGHVGDGDCLEDIVDVTRYTDPQMAANFVEQTCCDALAVAVGNAHGAYIQTPDLDFNRICEIRREVDIPLVLHGCSDIPQQQIQEAVRCGISKFNIATEYFRAMYAEIERIIRKEYCVGDAATLLYEIREGMTDFVVQKIRLLNPNKFSF